MLCILSVYHIRDLQMFLPFGRLLFHHVVSLAVQKPLVQCNLICLFLLLLTVVFASYERSVQKKSSYSYNEKGLHDLM